MKNLKVRLNKLSNRKYRCWLDGETSYLYGRSAFSENLLGDDVYKKEHKIEDWLKRSRSDFTKEHIHGCLPEWIIEFQNDRDFTMFALKYVDND